MESDVVMAGTGTPLRLRSGDPVSPAIHALAAHKDMDARVKPAHDGVTVAKRRAER
jgi:hypothetical protein